MILRVRARIRRRTGGCWGWDSELEKETLHRVRRGRRGHRAERYTRAWQAPPLQPITTYEIGLRWEEGHDCELSE
jgi:hypothetical protein